MQVTKHRPVKDSVERALSQVGDSWTFLILREAFFGVRRFDAIQRQLEVAPSILTNRLRKLVENGLLDRIPYQERPTRFEYRLTEKGRDLYPTITALMSWGDRWLSEGSPPLTLIHLLCGHETHPKVVCDACSQPLTAGDMDWQPSKTAE